ncbi:MAG TPA: UrcA family protein [Steroidobacteraceae bacterium]|nr:UrcA family protein [Steroidobacteraceae bacterium]
MKTVIASTYLAMAATLTLLAFSCGAVCLAGDKGDVPQAVVKFADLKLSSPEQMAVLYARIAGAADEVCKSVDTDSRLQPDLSRMIECVHATVRDAVAKINRPALSAIYNARNRDPLPITLMAAQR